MEEADVTKTMPIETRIQRRLLPNLGPDDCWEWQGWRTWLGYGSLMVARVTTFAHRLSYEYYVGPIPDGLVLDHLCRNPPCVNPRHLEPVTHQENVDRGINCRRTHCQRGHEFTASNTYVQIDRKGTIHRTCLACRNARNTLRFK